MDINEFRDFGFLQEVNRKFFHPLGLALEIIIEEDGSAKMGGVWDYREDPEGMFFVPTSMNIDKADRVEELRQSKVKFRIDKQEEFDVEVGEDGVQII